MSNLISKLPVFENGLLAEFAFAGHQWTCSRVSPYGPHGPLEQVHWFAGKTDLTWSPLSKVDF